MSFCLYKWPIFSATHSEATVQKILYKIMRYRRALALAHLLSWWSFAASSNNHASLMPHQFVARIITVLCRSAHTCTNCWRTMKDLVQRNRTV